MDIMGMGSMISAPAS